MTDEMDKTPIKTMHRGRDHRTSVEAAKSARKRTLSQKEVLLRAYASAPDGLTDEEAGFVTGLANKTSCCYWKRCGDLRREGFIEDTGITRKGVTGNSKMVCRITVKGLVELVRLG